MKILRYWTEFSVRKHEYLFGTSDINLNMYAELEMLQHLQKREAVAIRFCDCCCWEPTVGLTLGPTMEPTVGPTVEPHVITDVVKFVYCLCDSLNHNGNFTYH